MSDDWLDEIKWTADGLVPAVAQDAADGKILMLAWMNREALQLTAKSGKAVYWSRSRKKLWHKGEESGHQQSPVISKSLARFASTVITTSLFCRLNNRAVLPVIQGGAVVFFSGLKETHGLPSSRS